MAASIRITDLGAYSGEYELDLANEFFTNGELRDIKLMTGVRGGELQEAIDAGDNDVVVAFAVVAIRRAGKTVDPDVLWKAQAGSIVFDTGVPEDEEDEQSLPPQSEPSEPVEPGDESESNSRSGSISALPSAPSQEPQPPIGIPDSDIGAA
jgi:hypothetical protein